MKQPPGQKQEIQKLAWAVSEAEPEVPGAGAGAAISFPSSIEVGLPTGEMAAPKKKKKTIQDYAVHLN